ncbi:pantoate--beta-alanine ligase [Lujinxingia litoralis]|uniref:Pantothenate synthetase n=1 Tax=Lujinxingia litoralis TaxID=2211119 RepID=A0A328C8I3_9DELT|nr:pantoate--beta-alanine ligase [Lujinxingia litoralis]RAL22235.1 pantoate--beta-alanine ligase [Lujinxingia litoralis]
MEITTSIEALRTYRRALPGTVGFVPTMGYLHEGHLALMREARKRCDHLIVNIFVNPTQFAPGEDLDRYPRDPQGDAEKCRQLGCDILSMPTEAQIYAPDHSTEVRVGGLDTTLCGPGRPTHFAGVTTIVAKLFNLVQPDVAVFGQKDYQQLAIVRRMVRDLNFPIEIVGVPTVREADGLALSSRNRFLSPEHRRQATALSGALVAAHQLWARGERSPAALVQCGQQRLAQAPDARPEYLQCVHPDTLREFAPDEDLHNQPAHLAMAVRFGDTRLIDNLRLDEPLPPGPLELL